MDREPAANSASTEGARRNLSDLKPGIDYEELTRLPRGFSDGSNRLKFVKACEAVGVANDNVPWQEEGLVLMDQSPQGIAVSPLTFTFPAFDLMNDDHRTWKKKADKAWLEFRDREYGPYLKKCTKLRRALTVSAFGMRAKRNNELPEALRYELAARRYGLRESWSSLHRRVGGYSEDSIRLMITALLRSLGLPSTHAKASQP